MNNPKCPDYDKNKPNCWILYQDPNNLYSWGMAQDLPVRGFQRDHTNSEICRFLGEQLGEADQQYGALKHSTVLATPDDVPEGYIIEVDVD